MKSTASSVLTLSIALWAAPVFCAARDAGGEPPYDAKAEVNFTGTIVKVDEIAPGSVLAGFHLTVQTRTDSFEVYLGPASFIKRLDMPLRVGLKDIGVTGSRIKFAGNDLMLAREVRVEKTVFSLRDGNGVPNWLWSMRSEPPTGF
jgi:hypothetical protein